MLNQSFEIKTLLRLTRRQEIIRFNLGREQSHYENSLSDIAERINSDSFTFSSLIINKHKEKTIFSVDSAEDYYAIKKIAHDLKRLYKVKFSGRDQITEQISAIFHDTSAYSIIKIDISSFFESINFKDTIERLKHDNLLSYRSINILEKLSNLTISSHPGLPRGLGVSSILSEIYMESIDNAIKSIDGTYFYARYVDDMIIVTHSNTSTLETYKKIINETGLSTNNKSVSLSIPTVIKTYDKRTARIEFLGYEYIISNTISNTRKRHVNIFISRKKINKIKTRIIQSIQDFRVSKDYKTLESRLRFLSSNYPIESSKYNKHLVSDNDIDELRGGIYYNNKYITTPERLQELNHFLTSLMFSKRSNSIGKTIQSIPIEKRRKLAAMDFKSGFIKKHYHDFSKTELNLICSCWN